VASGLCSWGHLSHGNLNDVLVPCDLDEETNLPIDVITDEPIPKEKLIRIRCNGILRCYNIDTLVDTLQDEPKIIHSYTG